MIIFNSAMSIIYINFLNCHSKQLSWVQELAYSLGQSLKYQNRSQWFKHKLDIDVVCGTYLRKIRKTF